MKLSFISTLLFSLSAMAEQVTVLGINDMHAEIGNIPLLASCLKEERAKSPRLLLLSAGDNRTGNPYVDNCASPGRPMIDLMNRLGFDASTFGNHEFDGGSAVLRDYVSAADFPFLCANFFAKDTLGINTYPYRIFERNGIKIGVLGLVQIGENGMPDAHPDKCRDMGFSHPFTIAKAYTFLRSQCDVLILLTHLGFEDDVKLAELFSEADAIIGGHSHTRIENGHIINGVLITQAQNKVHYVTKLTFDVENGKVLSKKSELIPLRNYTPDSEITSLVEQIKDDSFFKRKLTIVKTDINSRESLGCMMADAIRAHAGTDIAVVNIGNVRVDTFPAGPFTVEDVYRLDPFGNDLVRLELSGQELIELLQNIPTSDHHGAPCVSGICYKATKPVAELTPMCITEITLEDGTPIDKDTRYSLCMNSYLASTIVFKPSDSGTALHTNGADCLIRFLEQQDAIDYSTTTRARVTLTP